MQLGGVIFLIGWWIANLHAHLCQFIFVQSVLLYQWLEDSLKVGELVPQHHYILKEDDFLEKGVLGSSPELSAQSNQQSPETSNLLHSNQSMSMSSSPEVSRESGGGIRDTTKRDATVEGSISLKDYNEVSPNLPAPVYKFMCVFGLNDGVESRLILH